MPRLFGLLLMLVAIPPVAWAYEGDIPEGHFRYGGIAYHVTDSVNKNVACTGHMLGDKITGDVVIPSTVQSGDGKRWTVTSVGNGAFNGEAKLTSVVLPTTLTEIGSQAFSTCSGLKSITIPAKVTYVGQAAFAYSGLGSVSILGGAFLCDGVFSECASLQSVTMPKVTWIGTRCFQNCNHLKEINIPASSRLGQPLTQEEAGQTGQSGAPSGQEAWINCSRLKKVTIGEGITTIPIGCFRECVSLSSVSVPTSVTKVEDMAFYNTFSLRGFDFSHITAIKNMAFYFSGLQGDIVLPAWIKMTEGEQIVFAGTHITGFKWSGELSQDGSFSTMAALVSELEYIDLSEADFPCTDLSREEGIFAYIPTHTVVYLPKNRTPTFAEGQDVNFVYRQGGEWVCNRLSLQDGADYEFPIPFRAKSVTYDKWDAEYVVNEYEAPAVYGDNDSPVSMKYSFWSDDGNSLTTRRDFSAYADGTHCFSVFLPYAATLPQGIRAYKLVRLNTHENDDYAEYYRFVSVPDGSTLEANKPYLLRITDGKSHDSSELDATDQRIEASSKVKTSGGKIQPVGWAATADSWLLAGGTERIENGDAAGLGIHLLGCDDAGRDVWRPVGTAVPETTAAPFRAFIRRAPGVVGARRFVILDEGTGDTTGIDGVDTGDAVGDRAIYTLDGKCVGTDFGSLPSGVYIVRGKKIVK